MCHELLRVEQHVFILSLIVDGTTEKILQFVISLKIVCNMQWKGINRKQSTGWQHLSRLKASAFFSLQKKFSCYETQQLKLGTGTAI
jgi:hypothetical protein